MLCRPGSAAAGERASGRVGALAACLAAGRGAASGVAPVTIAYADLGGMAAAKPGVRRKEHEWSLAALALHFAGTSK